MDLGQFNKTVKQYRQGNITAAFGTELLTQGSTSIPNLLLKFYKQIGISDEEMMVLIQLLRIRAEEKKLNPTPEFLSGCLTSSVEKIRESLSNLLDNEIISLTQYYDNDTDEIITGYDLEPLMEKLSEIWACAKVQEIEKTRFLLEANQPQGSVPVFRENLYHVFEKEFGRPLSPMEVAQIQKWVEETKHDEIVLEALRRAVLMGKLNFKYIDSILLEWKKNNLRTRRDIENYDNEFKSKRAKTSAKRRTKTTAEGNDKKELFKTLYMG